MTTTALPVQLTKKHLILHRYLHESNNDTCSCCNLPKIYAPYKDVPQEPQTGHEVNAASTEVDNKDYTPSSHNSPVNYVEHHQPYSFHQEKTSSQTDEDYEDEDEEEEDDDDYEYVSGATQQTISTIHNKKRPIVNSNTTSSRKQPTTHLQQQQNIQTSANSSTEQVECCLLNCHNPCSNRLRFSLKSLELTHFKADFLEKDWNRICNYCYFHTLYTFKKQMASHQQNSSGDEATTTTTRKRRNSGAKRQRKEVTSSMFTALPSISAEYKPSSEEDESIFVKKARNV